MLFEGPVDLVAVVGGASDDGLRAEDLPGDPGREVVLAEMDAVGAGGQGDVRPVVDDEGDAVAAGHVLEPLGLLEDESSLGPLLPQLDDPNPRGTDEVEDVQGEGRVADEVERGPVQGVPCRRGRRGPALHRPDDLHDVPVPELRARVGLPLEGLAVVLDDDTAGAEVELGDEVGDRRPVADLARFAVDLDAHATCDATASARRRAGLSGRGRGAVSSEACRACSRS